jgi:large subunit ribosomal protein L4
LAELTAPLYSSSGEAVGSVPLDPAVFGLVPNLDVLHQVITAQLAGARAGTQSTKTRGDVRGGGRKPWKQKGLGRARQGSIRSPQWSGGGVAHGPKPRSYEQRTPKKMKRLALRSALSARASEEAVRVVASYEWPAPKTAEARHLLDAIGIEGKVLVVLDPTDLIPFKSFANLPQVVLTEPGQITAYDVLWAADLLFTSSTLGALSAVESYEVSEADFVKEAGE